MAFSFPLSLLESASADILKKLAGQTQARSAVGPKAEFVAFFQPYLSRHLGDLVKDLGEGERALLAEAAYGDGRVDPDGFQAKYGRRAPQIPREVVRTTHVRLKSSPTLRFHDDTRDDEFKDPIISRTEKKESNGCVYETVRIKEPAYLLSLLFEREGRYGKQTMPPEIREFLRTVLPKPAAATCETIDTLPTSWKTVLGWNKVKAKLEITPFSAEGSVLAEIRRVLAVIATGKVKVSPATGRPTGAGLQALGTALVLPEWNLVPPPEKGGASKECEDPGPGRAFAWGILVRQLGWARPRGSALELTRPGQAVAADPQPEHIREAMATLETDATWDELHRVKGLRGLNGRGRRYLEAASSRRQPILEALADLPVGRWVTLPAFERFMTATGRRLRAEVDERGSLSLYFCSANYGHLSGDDDLCRWVLRVFLMEAMAPLGLIDIGYTAPHGIDPGLGKLWGTDELPFFTPADGLLFLRLTSLGAFCLGARHDYEAPVVERPRFLEVLPSQEIVATRAAEVPFEDRLFLDRCAAPEGKGWRLTPAALLAFLEGGGRLDEIRAFLEARAVRDLPATVDQLFDDVGRRAAAVGKPEAALLFPVADPATAALIAHDPKARDLCRLAGDRHLVVPEKNRRGFASALRRLGFLAPA